jgi:hypothetical protein
LEPTGIVETSHRPESVRALCQGLKLQKRRSSKGGHGYDGRARRPLSSTERGGQG